MRGIAMLKKILIALAAIAVVFVGYVACSHRNSASCGPPLSAPTPDVFAQVNNFHHWQAWSPWAKLDPAAKATFGGPPAGPGALLMWAGNDKVGEGRMTLTESHPSDLVKIKVEFVKPFEGTNTTEFTFKPQGDQTAVTWSMAGRNNFVAKALCLFMNMDRMIGRNGKRPGAAEIGGGSGGQEVTTGRRKRSLTPPPAACSDAPVRAALSWAAVSAQAAGPPLRKMHRRHARS